MNNVCYLDNNATTRIAPEVKEAMLPFLTDAWGNPSSAYQFGRQVSHHIETAREKVAALINAEPAEIIFTSCGTESNNTALHSALAVHRDKRHVITTSVEHPAILNYTRYLQNIGCEVTYLPVDADGVLDLHLLNESIRPDTALVSVMWANNETGVVFPMAEVSALCRSKGVMVHTDAVQAAGKIPLDVQDIRLDYMSLSAHKLHAPKGIGLLYVNRKSPFAPFIRGGHQETGRRGGTENVANIVAFGRAAELSLEHIDEEKTRVRAMRERMESGILQSISETSRNGAAEPRLPNTSSINFDGVEAESVLLALDREGICASSGSACTTGSLTPSHVLTAMGLSADRAKGCLRFSLDRYNTDQDVDHLLYCLPGIIERLRSMTPTVDRPAPSGSVASIES